MNIKNLFDLSGKVAIVTGGAQGLGRYLSIGLATYGADVMVADLQYEKAAEVVEEVKALGRRSKPYRLDVTKREQVREVVDQIHSETGHIDILVNDAGTIARELVIDLSEEDWDRVLNVNLKGAFLVGQAVGRHMVKQKKGKVINMSSVSCVLGHPKRAPYAASKGGITQLTKVMAIEWAPYGINVNAIAPTHFETPLTAGFLANKETRESLLKLVPMGRFGEPADIIGAGVFLASDASNYVTGETLFVDGGRTID